LDDLTCPACTAPGLLPLAEGTFRCEFCGTLLQGQPVTCPACGWENPQGAEDCRNCGEALSMVARVLTRQGALGPPFWLGRVRDRADELKRREAWASEQRMEHLREIDRRRIQDEARALARQRAADRHIVLALGVAVAVLAVIVATVVLLRFGGG